MLVDHYGGEIQNSIFIWSLIIFSPQCECNKLKTTTIDVLIHVVSNPVDEVADLRVDAGVEQTPTADAPADNPPEVALAVLAVADHGAPAVSLAAVLAHLPSADHTVRYGEWVLQPARPVRHYWDVDLHQPHRAAAPTGVESSPA